MTWLFQPPTFDSPNPAENLSDDPIPPHEAYPEFNQIIQDNWPALPNWEWPPSNGGRVIVFRGLTVSSRYRVTSPDPDRDWGSEPQNGGTQTSNQLLDEIYLRPGDSLMAIADSLTGHRQTSLGVPEIFGSTYYRFFVKFPDGALSDQPPFIPLLNYYSGGVKVRGYQLSPSRWQLRDGIQYDFAFFTKDFTSVTEIPIENYQYNAPTAPPDLPSVPPPPPPPPCDIQIEIDSSVGDGFFCMSFGEYENFTQRNQRANERLEVITNNLRRFP